MKNNNFLVKKLTARRNFLGLTKKDLAEKIGITPQAISQYEIGQTTPSDDIIIKISNILRVSSRFFFLETRFKDEKINPFFRSFASATKQEREKVLRYNDYIQEFLDIFSNYINFPKVDLPSFDWIKFNDYDELNEEDIEKAAIKLREYWEIGDKPIANLVKLLESKGIIIVRKQHDCKKIDAVSWWQPSIKRPVIFLASDKNNSSCSRFDTAHELGHILLHSNIEKVSKDNLKRIEREANRFASAFLLPMSKFSQEVNSSSLSHFKELKKRWKVSVQAMIYRCQDLKILNENQILYLRKQLSKLNQNKRDEIDDLLPLEMPVLFEKALTGIIDKELLSAEDYEEMTGLSSNEIENIFDLERGILKKEDNIVYFDFKNKWKLDKGK